MNHRLNQLLHDERGNLLEYLIVIGLVALLAIGAFSKFGSSVSNKVQNQASQVDGIGN